MGSSPVDVPLYSRTVRCIQSGAEIIRVSKGGEMLGAACVQVAFNLGNAIGAYAGGLAVSGGYRYPALAGVPFALIGFTLFLIFYKKYQARITEDDIIEND